MDLFEKCRQYEQADQLRQQDLYIYFHTLETRQDVEVIMEGKRRIMLGSNNYLGLTSDPEIIEAGIQALERYGTGCSGSRFLNGTLDMHLTLEEELAQFVGYESALVFSTGFQSNLAIISSLVGTHDYVICDKENHASIYDGCKLSYGKMLRYDHSDMAGLERCLEKVPEACGCLIITDGVFSMSGDLARLPEICGLAKKYGARVMVDDAHGLGTVGPGGRGTAAYFNLTSQVDVIMGTFSKSLASLGGYMAASSRVVDYVRHTARPFIFSASIPPANCAVALAALRKLRAHPELVERLAEISRYVRAGLAERHVPLREKGVADTPIVPIYTYDQVNTLTKAKTLFDRGVYVNAVLPPATAANECLLRTSYMATHPNHILDEAMDIMGQVAGEE